MNKLNIGIECKTCLKQWKLLIPETNAKIEAYASICECGSIIVGNINKSVKLGGERLDEYIERRYLTNGSHIVLGDAKTITVNLPELSLDL